jgi:uncharacterized membrane protein (UPF0127 family)
MCTRTSRHPAGRHVPRQRHGSLRGAHRGDRARRRDPGRAVHLHRQGVLAGRGLTDMRRYMLPGLCVLVLVLGAAYPDDRLRGPRRPAGRAAGNPHGGRRAHSFKAHLADTPETRARGLMYVTRLEADHGMLFDFETPRTVHMWMKNTPLSLDMLFIDEGAGSRASSAHTKPFSTRISPRGTRCGRCWRSTAARPSGSASPRATASSTGCSTRAVNRP